MTRSLQSAFTLIEALATVVLLGLAAAMLTPLVASGSESSIADNAIHRFLDLDARARLLAQSGSGAVLTRSGESTWQVFIPPDDMADPVLGWRGPNLMQIAVRDEEGLDIDRLTYDTAGRTIDFSVTVATDTLLRTVHVAGLSGWTRPEGER